MALLANHPLLDNPVAVTFILVAIGTVFGRLRLFGLSLGPSAVLFVALAFGHLHWANPAGLRPLGDFGVVLFVYAIGLQAGPRFVGMLRSKGLRPLGIGLATVLGGAAITALVGHVFGLEADMIVGIFAGALTSTPALAAATEASDSPLVSVAYGVAYPVGVIGVVLFAQLAPRLFSGHANREYQEPDAPGSEPVHQRCFQVQNPGCVGRRLSDLRLHDIASINISRVLRGAQVLPVPANFVLEKGDVVLAVGTSRELDRLTLILGPPVPVEVEMSKVPDVVARDIFISEDAFAGKRLRDLHIRTKYNVVITRVRRESVEFVPRGNFVLEVGDLVRAVGYEPDVRSFAEAAGIHERRIHETGIPAFAIGLVLGLLLGFTPIPVPGTESTIKLGIAGGPLFVGILLSHFGRVGRWRVHVPFGARYLMRELGLVLFLASAGVAAGAELLPTLRAQGVALVGLAAISTLMAIGIGFGLGFFVLRQSLPSALGMTCGAMTSTPGLGATSAQFDSDVPALSYAAVYPLALVAMTVVAQLLFGLLA